MLLGKTAAKQLDRFPTHDREAIKAALKVLARDPFSYRKAERLHEYGLSWRLRVRDYRVPFRDRGVRLSG